MSEILDDEIGRKVPDYIVTKTENLFSPPGVFAGYIFTAIGAIALVAGGVAGILPLALGVFLSFTHYGVKLDTANKKLKQYFSCFFIRTGKWEDIFLHPYICIMRVNKSYTAYGQTSVGTSFTDTSFDVFLLDKTHRDKIKIEVCPSEKEALSTAKALANKLGVEYTVYNPPISAKTKSRRR
ncbi:MAG: hypothetical protein AB7P01_13820 [Bacteroidia bacterium]